MLSNFEIDQRARKCLSSTIPDHWSLSTPTDDLGLDYWVQITKKGIPTGLNFFIQLKGTQAPKIKSKSISYSLSTKKLIQYLETSLPVLFVITLLNKNNAAYDKSYYCWIRKHVRELISKHQHAPDWWLSQKSVTIKIPRKQVLNQKSCNSIIEPYVTSYAVRHINQEEQHIEISQALNSLSTRVENFDSFFQQQNIAKDNEDANQVKQLFLLGKLCQEESKHEEALSYFESANKLAPFGRA